MISEHRRRRVPKALENGLYFVIVVVVAAIWLVPLVGIALTALKSQGELFASPPLSLPARPRLENFIDAWNIANFSSYGLRSLIITVVKVPLNLLLSAMAAFAFSRYQFPLKQPIFFIIVAGALIPLQIALIPLFGLLLSLNLLNTYPGLLLVYISFGFPVEVFLLRSFFHQVPLELDEAARLDGASALRILLQVIIPLSLPIMAAIFILDFVATWNEFQIALVLLQTNDMWTLPLGMLAFQQGHSGEFTLMSAAVLMASAPALVVYVLFQRFFVSGLSQGAVRG